MPRTGDLRVLLNFCLRELEIMGFRVLVYNLKELYKNQLEISATLSSTSRIGNLKIDRDGGERSLGVRRRPTVTLAGTSQNARRTGSEPPRVAVAWQPQCHCAWQPQCHRARQPEWSRRDAGPRRPGPKSPQGRMTQRDQGSSLSGVTASAPAHGPGHRN